MNAEPSVTDVTEYAHGRVPRAVRERQILSLAEELFAERGYEGTSMDELARRAGVTKPIIYGIVASKEELFRRCFERAGEELAQSVATAASAHVGDLRGLLKSTTVAFLEFVDSHERAWAMLYSLDTGGRAASHVQEIRERQAQFTAALLAAEAGQMAPERLDALAWSINGAIEFAGHWRREHRDVPAEEAATWLVDLVVGGLEAVLSR